MTNNNKTITKEDIEICNKVLNCEKLCPESCPNKNDSNKCENIHNLIKYGTIPINYSIKTKFEFKCRICGNTEYEGVYIKNSSKMLFHGKSCPDIYKCTECSILFENAEKFSKYKR